VVYHGLSAEWRSHAELKWLVNYCHVNCFNETKTTSVKVPLFFKDLFTESHDLPKWRYEHDILGPHIGEYEDDSLLIERRSWMVKTPVSYSGGPGFKFRFGDRLSWLRLFVYSSVPSGSCLDTTLKLGDDHFLPHVFNSLFTHHPFIRRYIV
jgi:hypothetical protein